MLLRLGVESDFETFKVMWADKDGKPYAALCKSLRILYYLVNGVWKVPDKTIAAFVNKIPHPEGIRTKFRDDAMKVIINRDLKGRDLANKSNKKSNDNIDDRMILYANVPGLDAGNAWRLFQVFRKMNASAEKPVPEYLLEAMDAAPSDAVRNVKRLLESKKGNQSEGDIAMKRLEIIKRSSRTSFVQQVIDMYYGYTGEVKIGRGVGHGALLGLAIWLRRELEKEVELFLFRRAEEGDDFNWKKYLEERQEKADKTRESLYPEFASAILTIASADDGEDVFQLLQRIEA